MDQAPSGTAVAAGSYKAHLNMHAQVKPQSSRVYKFFNSSLARSILWNGSVKVGTSVEYRVSDGFDDGRSDWLEVSNLWDPAPGEYVAGDIPGFLEAVYKDATAPAIARTTKLRFERGVGFQIASDVYIFSFSLSCSKDIRTKMADVFKADACYEIEDITAFAKTLSNGCPRLWRSTHPGFRNNECLIGAVTYDQVANPANPFGNVDPFSKRAQFQWQHEGRLVWGGEPPNKSFIANLPEVLPLIRRIF